MFKKILALLLLFTTNLTNPTPATVSDQPLPGTGFINYAEVYDVEKIKEELNKAQYSCEMKASCFVEFQDVYSEGLLNLKNPNDFYIKVSIIPSGDNNSEGAIYVSPMVAPFGTLKTITLNQNLHTINSGVKIPCLLHYDCYRETEVGYEKIGSCGLNIVVKVN